MDRQSKIKVLLNEESAEEQLKLLSAVITDLLENNSKISRQNIINQLIDGSSRRISLFASIMEDQEDKIATIISKQRGQEFHLKQGDILFKENENQTNLEQGRADRKVIFVVIKGQLQAKRTYHEVHHTTVYSRGDIVGLEQLAEKIGLNKKADHVCFSETVMAVENSILYGFTANDFLLLLKCNKKIMIKLLLKMRDRAMSMEDQIQEISSLVGNMSFEEYIDFDDTVKMEKQQLLVHLVEAMAKVKEAEKLHFDQEKALREKEAELKKTQALVNALAEAFSQTTESILEILTPHSMQKTSDQLPLEAFTDPEVLDDILSILAGESKLEIDDNLK